MVILLSLLRRGRGGMARNIMRTFARLWMMQYQPALSLIDTKQESASF